MLLKIHTAYFEESVIAYIRTVSDGFHVRFLGDQADVFIPCPADQIDAALREIDAQLARPAGPDGAPLFPVPPPADDPGGAGPAGPPPPRGGYF